MRRGSKEVQHRQYHTRDTNKYVPEFTNDPRDFICSPNNIDC